MSSVRRFSCSIVTFFAGLCVILLYLVGCCFGCSCFRVFRPSQRRLFFRFFKLVLQFFCREFSFLLVFFIALCVCFLVWCSRSFSFSALLCWPFLVCVRLEYVSFYTVLC